MSEQDIRDVLVPVVGNEHLEEDDKAIIIPLDSTPQGSHNGLNHTPLRLNGGGDTSFDCLENVNLEDQVNDLQNSLSEQDIRCALLGAGYTIEVIDDILAAKVMAGVDDPSNSTLGVNQNGTSDVVSDDQGFAFDQDSKTADQLLREIRVKNMNRITIGTLNINSLAPKFEQLSTVIGNNLDILTIQETKLDSSFPPSQFMLEGYSEPYRLDRNRNGGESLYM